jgi:hypothetical protein
MPASAPLCALADLKSAMRISDTNDDTRLTLAISAASDQITSLTGEQFLQDDAPSARWYTPDTPYTCTVESFQTTTGLVIETYPGGLQAPATTWVTTDYQLEPLNGILDGMSWPYQVIRAIGTNLFPTMAMGYITPWPSQGTALVSVTAQWGWSAVPNDINEACILQAMHLFKSADVPFGATPFPEVGILRLQPHLHPTAAALIANYTRRVMVG